MHPRDLVWNLGCRSERIRRREGITPKAWAIVFRWRPDVRDPNSQIRGQQPLTTPFVYRIEETLDGIVCTKIGPIGPFELLALLDFYEPAPTENVLS